MRSLRTLLLLELPLLHRPHVLVLLLSALPLPPRELLPPPPDMVPLPRANLSTTVPAPLPLPRECKVPLRETRLPPRGTRLPPREPKVPLREARLPPLVSDLPLRDQEHLSLDTELLPSRTRPAPLPLARELPPLKEPKVPPREANQPQQAVLELLPRDQAHPPLVSELHPRDQEPPSPDMEPLPRDQEHPSAVLELLARNKDPLLVV